MSGSSSQAGPAFQEHAYHDYPDSLKARLEMYDGRDHERAVNYPVEWFLENFDDHAWDLVLKEVPVVHTGVTASDDEIGNDLVDVDVGFVDLDAGRIKAYQMKRSNTYMPHAEGQDRDTEEFFDKLRETLEGFGWDYLGQTEAATNIPQEEARPAEFRSGYVYGPPEARQRARESYEYENLNEYVFDGRIELVDENLLDILGTAELDDLVGGEI
ncbi:MAG: hypothetical protein ABEJ91_02185 [Candidatus Nanohaloarchaea archaeon]